jgi:hypothetical protein
VEARNMMYPTIISGAEMIRKMFRRSKRHDRKGNKTVKKAPTM